MRASRRLSSSAGIRFAFNYYVALLPERPTQVTAKGKGIVPFTQKAAGWEPPLSYEVQEKVREAFLGTSNSPVSGESLASGYWGYVGDTGTFWIRRQPPGIRADEDVFSLGSPEGQCRLPARLAACAGSRATLRAHQVPTMTILVRPKCGLFVAPKTLSSGPSCRGSRHASQG